MVLLCLFLLVSGARADEASRLDLFDACWNTVARRLFDRDARGRGLEAARDRFRPRAAAADSTEGVRAVLDEMLASLDVSHAAILDRRVHAMVVRELAGERVWTFGAVLEEAAPGRLFVRALYDGSPLDAAGVRFGDRIVAIDGGEARASGHLLSAGADARDRGPATFLLAAAEGARLRLTVQPDPDAASRRDVSVEAAWMNGVDALRNGARVVRSGGRRIGVAHLWLCQAGAPEALHEALTGPLRDCDALVLDLRGRGGYRTAAARVLDLFRRRRGPPVWPRPVVFLIDGATRSAKELMAYRIRRLDLGPLVGTTTAGAVLATEFFPLPDDLVLELPVTDVAVDGKRLENAGVAPDHEVDLVVPYAAGRDPVLETGIGVAAARVREFIFAAPGAVPGCSGSGRKIRYWTA
jgi:carboxyl-terminal processing protease